MHNGSLFGTETILELKRHKLLSDFVPQSGKSIEEMLQREIWLSFSYRILKTHWTIPVDVTRAFKSNKDPKVS